MALGIFLSVPGVLVPLLFPSVAQMSIPITQRYWFKASLWIFLFGFVGNYFWTHYFFTVLGSKYLFPVSIKLNEIPVFLYLVTQAYFVSYHTFSSVLLRRWWTSKFYQNLNNQRMVQVILNVVLVCLMAYITAVMEAVTISKCPFYTHPDNWQMYVYGSTFYGLYFVVSFPMFIRLDESGPKWDWRQTAVDSLASAMMVFLLCDFYRLLVGRLPGVPPRDLPWQHIN